MNGNTKKQLKHSTIAIMKGLGHCSKGAAQYGTAAVSGAVVGGVAGGAVGIGTGLIVTAATAGMDLGITPAALGIACATTGAGIGAAVTVEIVRPFASRNIEEGRDKLNNGIEELKIAVRHMKTYRHMKNSIFFSPFVTSSDNRHEGEDVSQDLQIV